jgi:hypothetical protein
MNDFDEILEECLDKIASGESTLEECLARNPKEAAELEPYLRSVERLQRGKAVTPSPLFAARLRSELMQKMQATPPPKRRLPVFFRQMALNLGVLFLMFALVSTAFAQGSVPGETLYGVKLASESVWRVLTTDPVGTDLEIANRRVNEYVEVSRDEVRRARVLTGYHDVMVRFQNQADEQEKARILQVLKSQQDSLRKVGLSIPELDSYFSGGATEPSGDFPNPDPSVTRPTPKP